MEKQFYVYILASKREGTLYTGVTSNLIKRIWQHKNELLEGFSKKYKVKNLVYYEVHNNVESALTREKRIKKWRRAWKLRLIEEKILNGRTFIRKSVKIVVWISAFAGMT